MPTHTHTHAYAWTHRCAGMNAPHTRMHARTHARTHTFQAGKIWDSRHTHMEICVSINTLHTYIHTYVRMYVCTYVLTVTVTPDNSKKSDRIQYYENIIMTGNWIDGGICYHKPSPLLHTSNIDCINKYIYRNTVYMYVSLYKNSCTYTAMYKCMYVCTRLYTCGCTPCRMCCVHRPSGAHVYMCTCSGMHRGRYRIPTGIRTYIHTNGYT